MKEVKLTFFDGEKWQTIEGKYPKMNTLLVNGEKFVQIGPGEYVKEELVLNNKK